MRASLSLKAFVLNEYFVALEIHRKLSFYAYQTDRLQRGDTDLTFDECLDVESDREYLSMRWSLLMLESESHGFDRMAIIKTVENLNFAYYERLRRLRSRVVRMVEEYNSLWFVTLTFDDYCLSHTSADTRKRYVKEFLNEYSEYIANIDFGKKNDREHYHALIASEYISNDRWQKYGFIYPELCYMDVESDLQRVSKYVAKLSNHAVKNTAKQNKIIYSRRKKK